MGKKKRKMAKVIFSGSTGIAYSYDYATKDYVGETECQYDPLGTGGLLVPAYATSKKPPMPGEGQWPYWNGNDWELITPITDETGSDSTETN